MRAVDAYWQTNTGQMHDRRTHSTVLPKVNSRIGPNPNPPMTIRSAACFSAVLRT